MSEFLEKHLVKATFDTSKADSSGAANTTAAAHGLGVYIPLNAIIVNAFYDVTTTFASTAGGTDKATIALKALGTGDIVAAVAIELATNPYDAGIHTTIVGAPTLSAFHGSNNPTALEYASTIASAPALTMIKCTSTVELTATVGTCALTAGKLNLYVEYVMSDLT